MLPDIPINFRENLQVSLQSLNWIPVFAKNIFERILFLLLLRCIVAPVLLYTIVLSFAMCMKN